MKNILIISQHFPPEPVGRASRVYEMAEFLKKYHNVTILVPPPTWPFTKFKKAKHFHKVENLSNLKVHRLKCFQPSHSELTTFERIMYLSSFPILSSLYLFKELHKTSTIIVATPPTPLLMTTLVARIFRKRIVIDIGDLWETHEGKNPKHKFLRKLMKRFEISCWKNADLILTNNKILQERIKKILGKKNFSKVEFFPYIVYSENFKKQNVELEKQIVYIGSFGKFYNIKVLLNVMKIASKKIPDLKLQLYGGGEDEEILKKLVKELDIENCCIFNSIIPKKDIPTILSKSLLGIIPYTINEEVSHAFPTKAFEYMSCSLPVFAFGPKGELSNLITKSGAGIFVEGNDHGEIAKELVNIINGKKSLENFSKNAQNYIENYCNFSYIAKLM